MFPSDLPESVPLLTGLQTSYKAGEPVRVNCTSPLSMPAATLEWHVNGEMVVRTYKYTLPLLNKGSFIIKNNSLFANIKCIEYKQSR